MNAALEKPCATQHATNHKPRENTQPKNGPRQGDVLHGEQRGLGTLTLPQYGYLGSPVLRATRTLDGPKPVILRGGSIHEDYPNLPCRKKIRKGPNGPMPFFH
jgi:hypothetical protein